MKFCRSVLTLALSSTQIGPVLTTLTTYATSTFTATSTGTFCSSSSSVDLETQITTIIKALQTAGVDQGVISSVGVVIRAYLGGQGTPQICLPDTQRAIYQIGLAVVNYAPSIQSTLMSLAKSFVNTIFMKSGSNRMCAQNVDASIQIVIANFR